MGSGQLSSSLRSISKEEGTECGEYAWNWNKPGGGPPWKNTDQDLLSVSDKTHLLHNAYAANIKQAIQSLKAQRNIPDFLPILWCKVLANQPVNFGALLEDRYSNTTTFNDLIDLGEGFELTTKKPANPKTKISNHSQWMYAWSKYRTAITWAFPHRMAEVYMYEKHIIRPFNSDLNPFSASSMTRLLGNSSSQTNSPSLKRASLETSPKKIFSLTQEELDGLTINPLGA